MRRDINVLLVSHFSNLSGAPISLALLASHLGRYGYHVLVTIPSRGPLEQVLKQLNVQYTVIGTVTSFVRLPFIIMKHNISLVHANTVIAAPAALQAKLLRRKLLWHIREDISANLFLKRLVGHISDRVVVLSQSMLEYFPGRIVREKVRIVHNGVDFTLFAALPGKNRERLKAEMGIEPGKKTVAVIGTIEKRKGQRYFIDAVKLLSHRNDIRFFIIGNPLPGTKGLYKALKAECAEQALPVTFLPARSDVPSLLQMIDVVCVPSLGEPFGRVVIEGMAAGKPVIGSNVGGIPEIIQDGVTGMLVEPADPHAIADRIMTLVDDERLAAAMGAAGRERACRLFSIEKHAEQIAGLYEEIMHEL